MHGYSYKKGKNYNKPKTREKKVAFQTANFKIYTKIDKLELEQALFYFISWRGFPFYFTALF